MLVTITNVSVENIVKGRSRYSKATVNYTWNGEARSQSIMSFSNPTVFKEVQELVGQTVEVEVGKNEAGYSEWRSIQRGTGNAAPAATGAPGGAPAGNTRVVGSNYETKEERAFRQVLIVRQSSLTAALNTLSPGAKAPLDSKEVKALADEYAEWVFAPANEQEAA
jgi:hypothetical protein